MNVTMCGALLSSLLEESSDSDVYHFGVLYGAEKTSKHVQQTDTEEDCIVTTTDMTITGYLSTRSIRPFVHGNCVDLTDPSLQPNNTGKDILGLFCLRHDSVVSPSFRDVQTLRKVTDMSSKAALLLIINLPPVEKESWLYAMTYKCYFISTDISVPQPIALHLPSLAADAAKEYSNQSSIHPTLSTYCSASTACAIHKAAQDTIVQTVNTELAVQQVHSEIKDAVGILTALQLEVNMLRNGTARQGKTKTID